MKTMIITKLKNGNITLQSFENKYLFKDWLIKMIS